MSGIARIRNKKITFAPRKRQGEMLEWLKRHAWKACKRRNRFGGSNPPLSAGRVGFKSFLRKVCRSPQAEPKMVSHTHYYIYSQNLDLS